MCGSRRRYQNVAAMNPVGMGYGTMGGVRSCHHNCGYGCQSGCSHPCQQRGCQPSYGAGCGMGGMGMYGQHQRGCCGGRRRRGGLIMGVVVPLVKKAIDNHNQKKAVAQGQQSQISQTRDAPQTEGVVPVYKNEKASVANEKHEKHINEEPPTYSPTSEEQSPFIDAKETSGDRDLPNSMPQTAAVERLVAELTNAISTHHFDRRCGTKKAVRVAKKALRNELEEIEEARIGRSLNCAQWKVLSRQVDELADQIELAHDGRY